MAETQQNSTNAERIAQRFSMQGRRALVTGGSVSIGRAIALAFAEAGADIAVHYSTKADAAFGLPNAASDTVTEITERGRKGVAVEADFSIPGEARRCVEAAIGALSGLDVVVVCASVQKRIPFLDYPMEEMERQVRINFLATLELLQAALPGMRERGWGRVLTIGSINEMKPEPDQPVYAALKSAQTNLAVNLARDNARYGITVNNLAPGLIATERNRWRRQDADVWAEIQKQYSPLGRAGTPDEMAAAALLLCSEAGSYITGANLEATGGAHL
jgi:NAD(P)-dependent dehydrogenase (short-subunit alcohol dehydrogenase family)